MDYRINQQERDALKGLPHLPRLTYLEAIRPYMDYSTGIVGIKRGISYQSLREELYVEPHTGYVSGSPSKPQLRRALQTLERAGLITIQSIDKKLILKCELATWDYCEQNKPITNPSHQVDTKPTSNTISKTSSCNFTNSKPDTGKSAQPVTPPESGINNIFVCLKNAFEKFWQMYPVKHSRAKAWKEFQKISPTPDDFAQIISALNKQREHYKIAIENRDWIANWKHPGNWLAQECWKDEVFKIDIDGENDDAGSKKRYTRKNQSRDLIWESCKHSIESEEGGCLADSNVIDINAIRPRSH